MPARLFAISDLHIGHRKNREALEQLEAREEDWLILGGDLGETTEHLETVFSIVRHKFHTLFWVPGNHELWTTSDGLKGQEKYDRLIEICREHDVHTPEDPYVTWGTGSQTRTIVPMFLLYDYSFAPQGLGPDEARAWAKEEGIVCSDERYIDPAPYATIQEWCAERCDYTRKRLEQLDSGTPNVFVNHFPLRRDLVRLFRIPRFIPWCGTQITEDWHRQYNADVVVSGHLHMRATDWRDYVRFEEVSLGYPRHWDPNKTVNDYVRQILPYPDMKRRLEQTDGFGGPIWRR